MYQNDKSFQALILSLVVHALLAWWMARAPSPDLMPADITEVEYLDPNAPKAQTFVTETDREKELLEKLKTQADYLSQVTKRVKEQMRARNNGPTQNASPNLQPSSALNSASPPSPRQPTTPGEGPGRKTLEQSRVGRTMVMGESSMGEYIPGVREGSFTALNTDQFTYYTFFARVNEQVRYRWVPRIRNYVGLLTVKEINNLARYERSSQVEIILERNGQFKKGIVLRSSGDKELDQAAIEAFREAAPLNNPPTGLLAEDGLLHLYYNFVVQFRPQQMAGDTNN